jgi:hypothetical protein
MGQAKLSSSLMGGGLSAGLQGCLADADKPTKGDLTLGRTGFGALKIARNLFRGG